MKNNFADLFIEHQLINESLGDIEKAFEEVDVKIDKAIEKYKDEKNISNQNEGIEHGLASLVIGGILSAPFVIEIFGSIFKIAENIIRKFVNSEGDSKTAGEKIISWAHRAHHKLLTPFTKLSKLLFKNKSKAHNFSEFLFYLTIAGFLMLGFQGKIDPSEFSNTNKQIIQAYNTYIAALSAKKAIGAMELAKYTAIIIKKKVGERKNKKG